MESINKVLEALSVIERYEEYLFNRAWGRAFSIIGTVFPFSILIGLNLSALAPSVGSEFGTLVFIIHVLALFFCWGLVMYSFAGAWRTAVRDLPEKKEHDSKHGVIIGALWFICFMLANLAPETLTIIAMLWASGVSCFLTYVVLKITGSHVQERIILTLGLLLILLSLPILLITDIVLSQYASLLVFSISFITASAMMHRLAAKTLQGSSVE